jgi:shikimate 5-dehydrogenase
MLRIYEKKFKTNPFLKKAKEVGCEVIFGEEMFWNQAAAQSQLWNSPVSL